MLDAPINVHLKLLSFLLFMLLCTALPGQAKLKKAIKEMDALNYTEAIRLLTEALEKENAPDYKLQLAECYRRTNNWKEAVFWYGQIMESGIIRPIHQLYYGQALQREGQCDKALKWFEAYAKAQPNDVRAQHLVQSCIEKDYLQSKNALFYTVTPLSINTEYNEHCPTFIGNSILFASDRPDNNPIERTNAWTGQEFLDFYYAENMGEFSLHCSELNFRAPEKYLPEFNSPFHDAVITFTENGKTAFFTRTTFDSKSSDGIAYLKIFFSQRDDLGVWSKPELHPINDEEYSFGHPSVSPDGNRLYFVSDRPEGYGGMDIYVSEHVDGNWSAPINLGPTINTEGNEVFPYFHAPTNTLYFASDGHIGLGGLDIYYTQERAGRNWGMIINPGSPINSLSDDFGIIVTEPGTFGYFSSDRSEGAGKDDLYAFCKTSSTFNFLVYDVVNKEALETVDIFIEGSKHSLATDREGKATFELALEDCAQLVFNKPGYLPNNRYLCAEKIGESRVIEIPLEKEPLIQIEGIVFDEDDFPKEGATVTLFTDCPGSPPVSMVTNATGRYLFKVNRNCCYTAIATALDYQSISSEQFCTMDLLENKTFHESFKLLPGKAMPLLASKGPEPLPQEAVTESFEVSQTISPQTKEHPTPFLLAIFYDFNSAKIKLSSKPTLNRLLLFLNQYPDLIIEIGSHTDARGNKDYNLELSQKRANAVKNWLENKGIARERLIAKGYGQSLILNECKEGIDCEEAEHLINRRTEFRILNQRILVD